MYYAFDPGPTVGWAQFNERGHILNLGQIPLQELPEWLEKIPTQSLSAIIYEDYKVLPHKMRAHVGRGKNKVVTVECIGVLKSWAVRKKIPIVVQDPQILDATQKHTQVFMPKNHDHSHQIAAFLHGARYLIDKGIRLTALEMATTGEAINQTEASLRKA